MALLPGYELKEAVCWGLRTRTYSGCRISDGAAVLIKIATEDLPTPWDLSRLKYEHALTSKLDVSGVLRTHEIIRWRSGLALVQEGFEGVSLKQYLAGRPLDPGQFLRIAIQLAETLEGLHRHDIIHNGIHPGSILISPGTGETKLTNCDKAVRLSSERRWIQPAGVLEGELAYISPEQTGRMNRLVDERADLYSLGVTLYEMLTGTPPFTAADPLEWTHCHIARQPEPLHRKRPSIPKPLSNIVLKLLAKEAEDRYQSASGLRTDLTRCLAQWETSGTIAIFSPGEHDIPEHFLLPQKVYGRQEEIADLLRTFDSAASGRAILMLVSGYSGVGKSSLIREVHKPVVQRRGYFISGKFDQLNRDQPYSAFIQAFHELVRQLLTEGDTQVARWREQLVHALGNIGQIIIDVIPAVELIIGPQPPLPELPPMEAQHRFYRALQCFVQVFTRPEHPIVLFLDDLQWADGASLGLLQSLCLESDQRHLLIISAYRNNEAQPSLPFMLTLKDIQQSGGEVRSIELAPLPASAVHQLTADALHCNVERVGPLAELVLARTDGNPFFVNEFLKTLVSSGLLAFSAAHREWTWNLSRIQALDITDNVADLMHDKMEGLASFTRELLKRAACVGNRFDARTLSLLAEQPVLETGRGLAEAVQAGLVLPLDESHRLFDLEAEQLPDEVSAEYKFAHDQFQQTAYALIPPQERAALHRRIGKLLLRHAPPEEHERKLFTLVNQLNQGISELESLEDRRELAELNLRAGRKASASSAFPSALHYLRTGLELLGEAGWTEHYALTLALQVDATEIAYVTTSFEEMARLAEGVLRHARTVPDKTKVYEVQVRALIARNQLPQALHTALTALDMLGIRFPKNPGKSHILFAFLKARAALAGKQVEDLEFLPVMTDPMKRAAMRLLMTVTSVSYVATPELFPLIVFKQIEMSARHGNTAESCYAYSVYAVALCGVMGDVEGGYRFGELALRLTRRLNAREYMARVWMSVYYFTKPWKEPLQDILAPVLQGYQAGLETGDLEFAASLVNVYAICSIDIGSDLNTLSEEIAAFNQTTSKLKQERGQQLLMLMWQTARNLQGETEEPWRLRGQAYDEEQMLPLHLKANDINALATFYLQKLILSYLFRRHGEAAEHSSRMEAYLGGFTGLYGIARYYFYDSLVGLALLPDAAPAERRRLQKRIAANQKKLSKWVEAAPSNFLHKVQLVEAERARVRGDLHAAKELYERAISGAHEAGYSNEEALARELTGEFYRSLGQHELGQYHLSRAHHAYQQWGARAKARHLEALHPTVATDARTRSNAMPQTAALDLLSVTKASQAVSGEIMLERLLKRMMELVIENAGAQKGFFLQEKEGRLMVEAEASVGEEVSVQRSIPVETCSGIALGIVNYVVRTRETVVLDNATYASLFATDPYLLQAQPLSVLCQPLIHQGRMKGILYLENPHITGAFTPDRLEVLRLLSGQIAISLENAQLYNELEFKVEERTRELKQKNIELQAAIKDLRSTQAQLIQQEKLASLGHLTAGVAHEIKNPLNFVNNFAQHTSDLLEELRQEASAKPHLTVAEMEDLLSDLRTSAKKIHEHGQRADGIVRSMLDHSRASRGERNPTQLNALVDQYVKLVHQGTSVSMPNFICTLVREYDPELPEVDMVPQEMSRVLINLLNNAFYAVNERRKQHQSHAPRVTVRTRSLGNIVELRIEDNGPGVPAHVRQKMFEPFFTTKPAGQGTGLGLSISYDIITNGYGGTLEEQGKEGEGAVFVVRLPVKKTGSIGPRAGN